MTCPECGATKIHRSRRRGPIESTLLPMISVFSFRCSECRTRFHRYHAPRRRDPLFVIRDPPAWVKALIWTAIMIVAALVVTVLVVLVTPK